MLSRRLLVSLAALTASPAVGDEAVSDGALRNKILRTLSRVPVFTVTNGSDAPYLTEVDEQGRRSGFFYLGPQAAARALEDIRAFDPRARLTVVTLDTIWFEVAKTAEEAAEAPQPRAGTSTDLRLF